MSAIRDWLDALGLARYAETFEREEIEPEDIAELDDGELAALGLPLGPRKRILKAADVPAAAPAAPREAERRQITEMFCDLVGSTALSEKLDPEDLRSLMQDYQQAAGEVIERYGGHVAQYLGDGLMTYFGWPQAHEDDAERAVRASLDIVEAVGAMDLAVRIGIATGPVVVGETGAGDASVPKLAVGETPNLAARLQGLAGADEIVIGSSTRRLIGGTFELADLGEQTLKGIVEPVQAHRITGIATTEGRFEARTRHLTPLVGREAEMAMVMARWEQARAGEGQVILLSGEPGIGKSRITQTLRERVADEPQTRLRYQCSPYHTNSALHPVIEQIGRAASFQRDDSPDKKLDKLEKVFPNDAGRALVASLLSLPVERYAPLAMSPQKQKEETLRTLAEQVTALAATQPVLLIFEDTHWIDPTSQELLDIVVAMVAGHHVLAVITHRPEYQAPWLGQSHATPLALTRLGRAEAAALIARVSDEPLSDDTLDQIIAKTDGVPLFVEELTKAVQESGADTVPETLQDSLMARLDLLGEAKTVAQIGACIGRSFDYRLLSNVAELPAEALGTALDRLTESDVAFRRGGPPNATYSFKHAMIHEVANESLLRSMRRDIHRQIVRALQQDFPERLEHRPEDLARHLREAELFDEAVQAWLHAGKFAASRSATMESLEHFREGLRLVAMLADGPQRDRAELDLQLALGATLLAARGYGDEEARRAHERAGELSKTSGTVKQSLITLLRTSTFHIGRSEMRRSLEIGQELVSLTRDQSSASIKKWTLATMGLITFHMGDFPASLEWVRRSLEIPGTKGGPVRFERHSQDPITQALMYEGFALLSMGFPDQGLAKQNEAIRHARDHDISYGKGFALSTCGTFAFAGDTDRAISMTDEAIEIGRTQGYPYIEAFGLGYRGFAFAQGGAFADAVRSIDEGLAILARSNTSIGNSFFRPVLALAMGKMGRISDGLGEIETLLSWIGTTEESFQEAEAHRVKGELLMLSGGEHEPAAERSFQSAIDVARRQGAKWWELRAAISLARLWQSQGKTAQARDLLAPVHGWFTEGFDTADLKDARALLDALG